MVSGCQDVPIQNVEGRERHDGTQVGGEDHAGEALKVEVNDDRGGNGTEGPQDEDHDHGLHDRRQLVPKDADSASFGIAEGAPTPDDAQAGDLRSMTTKTSCLARMGGGHDQTCSSAHFILVSKTALLFPRALCWVHFS